MKFSKSTLRDKIYGCWVGKNIGGTIGTPFEGKREILDVKGFTSEKGEPLPNDDLDLQLAWLRCIDELGPEQVNSKTLGEYWLSFVKPHWNEYGVCKSNMRAGFLPPVSGELFNEEWQNSNGAWIRTEIWASLYPGQVEKAIRYSFEDASVDHGFGEGTYAAIFVAAVESAAYVINDVRMLIKIGLSKIPEDSRVSRAVRLVVDEFDKGTDWKTVRGMLVEQSADIGWFQAPANVAYCILGLLYGKGDFKNSILLAVDCGDDTDCTGATVGAVLGILYGASKLPADWKEYIGDSIVSGSLLFGHGRFPKSCTELTDCVMNMHGVTLRTSIQDLYKGLNVEIGDEDDFSSVTAESMMGTKFVDTLKRRSRYSFTGENCMAQAFVNFDEAPFISAEKPLTGYIFMMPHTMPESRQWRLNWVLPEGWHVSGRSVLATNNEHWIAYETNKENNTARFTISCDGKPAASSTLILDISAADRPTHIMIPVTILGE